MLPLHDGYIRLMLLCHLVAQLEHGGQAECQDAGIEPEQLDCLRAMSMADIKRLASLRHPLIGVVVDGATFSTGMRNLAMVRQTQRLERYFIRHGASPTMLKSLFKLARRTALQRLRAHGHRALRGRPPMPPIAVRASIHRFWAQNAGLDLKLRYYRLHEAFASYTMRSLSGVINDYEKPKMKPLPRVRPGAPANLVTEIFVAPIAVHRSLVSFTGSVSAALMLSQAIAWTQTLAPEAKGWFTKSQWEWSELTGLAVWEQQGARRVLRIMGLLEERTWGTPETLWFHVRKHRIWSSLREQSRQNEHAPGASAPLS